MKHMQANHASLMTGVHSFHTTGHGLDKNQTVQFNRVVILLKVLDRSANKESLTMIVKPLHSPKYY